MHPFPVQLRRHGKEGAMFISLCLIALSLGYLVFLGASKEKEGLRLLGQVIGVLVMIVSFLATVCCVSQVSSAKGSWAGYKSTCPISK